ncbi:uncharacterized protein LACBIDRAFT_322474 [Laccaria bicolor S238N-H82]|uniref:Predicted protein n=1 Tax=Laccaria bicolor (strain S238N-H82 / ATCC MYA-4686) TaxID=486041 RepID=B0CWF2_LACBS|nr:uncharacterized protein LACBIDRAFT_322474 [Laccaria bicolor S238N-H82]EDR13055.1 predicted protein [Laccaria bicolor S238N-H82]|eukprot:XP_001875553.1 predicted protein [Laccaria bicolor S238N-H82]
MSTPNNSQTTHYLAIFSIDRKASQKHTISQKKTYIIIWHTLNGYFQRKRMALDKKKNRVWFHHVELDELEASNPKTAKLMCVLYVAYVLESRWNEWNQDVGSKVFPPMSQELATSIDQVPQLSWNKAQPCHIPIFFKMLPPVPEDGQDNDEDLNENPTNEIFIHRTRCITRGCLQKHTLKFKKLLDWTIFFFHVKLLKGEIFMKLFTREIYPQAKNSVKVLFAATWYGPKLLPTECEPALTVVPGITLSLP